jgi:hypothetical protein
LQKKLIFADKKSEKMEISEENCSTDENSQKTQKKSPEIEAYLDTIRKLGEENARLKNKAK